MSIVKSLVLSASLGLATLAYVGPAVATTSADIEALIVTRNAQIDAEIAALQQEAAGGVSPARSAQITAAIQLLRARSAQLDAVGPLLAGLPTAVLDSIEEFLQAEISAA